MTASLFQLPFLFLTQNLNIPFSGFIHINVFFEFYISLCVLQFIYIYIVRICSLNLTFFFFLVCVDIIDWVRVNEHCFEWRKVMMNNVIFPNTRKQISAHSFIFTLEIVVPLLYIIMCGCALCRVCMNEWICVYICMFIYRDRWFYLTSETDHWLVPKWLFALRFLVMYGMPCVCERCMRWSRCVCQSAEHQSFNFIVLWFCEKCYLKAHLCGFNQ